MLLYPVVFGIIKSSGFMFIKYVEVGILQGLRTGFKVPNQATKTMVIAAVLLQLQVSLICKKNIGFENSFPN